MTMKNRPWRARGDHVGRFARKLRIVVASDEVDPGPITGALADFDLEVTWTALDQMPERIVEAVIDEDADALALPILCADHLALLPRIAELLQHGGIGDIFMTLGEPRPAAESTGAPRRPSPTIPHPREVIASIELRLGPVPAKAISAIRNARPTDSIWVFFALNPATAGEGSYT